MFTSYTSLDELYEAVLLAASVAVPDDGTIDEGLQAVDVLWDIAAGTEDEIKAHDKFQADLAELLAAKDAASEDETEDEAVAVAEAVAEPQTEAEAEAVVDEVDPELIDTGSAQVRAPEQTTVAEYAEAMLAGDVFPPIVVYRVDDKLVLASGGHRYAAHLAARPGKKIRCEIRNGTLQDAIWFALGANSKNGARYTNEDKRKAVEMALELLKGVSPMPTYREIGRWIGVSHPFVSKIANADSNNELETVETVSTVSSAVIKEPPVQAAQPDLSQFEADTGTVPELTPKAEVATNKAITSGEDVIKRQDKLFAQIAKNMQNAATKEDALQRAIEKMQEWLDDIGRITAIVTAAAVKVTTVPEETQFVPLCNKLRDTFQQAAEACERARLAVAEASPIEANAEPVT